MKKIILLVFIVFMLVGCSFSSTPTSKVEELFMKYQKVDNDISLGIDNIMKEENLLENHRDRYRELLIKQYRNLTYNIKDEVIDGDKAIVTAEIEVIDYRKAIGDLVFDSNIYTKDSYDLEKINRLEKARDKVKYTLEFKLNKNSDGIWELVPLTSEQTKKIQGMF